MSDKLVLYKMISVSKGTSVTSTPKSHEPGYSMWWWGYIFVSGCRLVLLSLGAWAKLGGCF